MLRQQRGVAAPAGMRLTTLAGTMAASVVAPGSPGAAAPLQPTTDWPNEAVRCEISARSINVKYDPNQHHRRSIRLPGYDYRQAGWYFVTLVTQGREWLFEDLAMRRVAENLWEQIPRHFPHVSLDEWVVMPNHLHGIAVITSGNDVDRTISTGGPHLVPGSLGAIILNYKSVSTRRLNQMRGLSGRQVWQRNYYERVIRSDEELRAIRQYIVNNPAKWELDEHYTSGR